MKTSDFFFELPERQIAQTPIEPRDHSRMLYLDRQTGAVKHLHFYDLPDYLDAGDTLIVNTSRVIPARLYGVKEYSGGHMQFLLLEQKERDIWEVMVKPGKQKQKLERGLYLAMDYLSVRCCKLLKAAIALCVCIMKVQVFILF